MNNRSEPGQNRFDAKPGRSLSFKVDVDTHQGMRDGVPVLSEIFAQFGIKATFFLSFGPDNAGKAIFNVFRRRGFLKKMLRTGAPALYGWRTILSGTLLPARPIALAFPEIVQDIRRQGHEVGVHAWDHRYWQDHLLRMSEERIAGEFAKSFRAFRDILQEQPLSVAAPGWQVTWASLTAQDRLGIVYASDLRGGPPCYPAMKNQAFSTLQIPTTTRCLEELIALGMSSVTDWQDAFDADLDRPGHHVFPLHAEVEGGKFHRFFRDFLPKIMEKFPRIIPLREYADSLLAKKCDVPVREVKWVSLPGRAGCVASATGAN